MNYLQKTLLTISVLALGLTSLNAQVRTGTIYYKTGTAKVKPDSVQTKVDNKKDLKDIIENSDKKDTPKVFAVEGKAANRVAKKKFQTMAYIPEAFDFGNAGQVKVTFGNTSDGKNSAQLVSEELVNELELALVKANANLPEGSKIFEIHVSSTTNGRHANKSNHYYGTAVDISRINGVRMVSLGSNNQVKELQKALDASGIVRENFGPHFKHKTYMDGTTNTSAYVRGHKDHIHFSIQGEHNAEECDCKDSKKFFDLNVLGISSDQAETPSEG